MKGDDDDTPRPNGLPIGSIAPLIDTNDIDGKIINLTDLLKNYNGVMIDFFRGNW
jgi:hypothetical protein